MSNSSDLLAAAALIAAKELIQQLTQHNKVNRHVIGLLLEKYAPNGQEVFTVSQMTGAVYEFDAVISEDGKNCTLTVCPPDNNDSICDCPLCKQLRTVG